MKITVRLQTGARRKMKPGTSVSIKNLNALVEESVKTSEGNNRKKVTPPKISPTEMVISLPGNF